MMLSIAGVRAHWPWIRKGIERIVEKNDGDFMPEDVFLALMTNDAVCVVHCDDNGDERGFSVLQRLQARTGEVTLFVWCMEGDLMHMKDKVMQELEDIARQQGARKMQARSPRKGWAKLGFKVKETVYEREVNHG